jgi:hypothetical protein
MGKTSSYWTNEQYQDNTAGSGTIHCSKHSTCFGNDVFMRWLPVLNEVISCLDISNSKANNVLNEITIQNGKHKVELGQYRPPTKRCHGGVITISTSNKWSKLLSKSELKTA